MLKEFSMLCDISGLLANQAYPECNDNPYPAGTSKWIQTKLSVCKCSYNYGLTWCEIRHFIFLIINRQIAHLIYWFQRHKQLISDTQNPIKSMFDTIPLYVLKGNLYFCILIFFHVLSFEMFPLFLKSILKSIFC